MDKQIMKKIISIILTVIMVIAGIFTNDYEKKANADVGNITIYLIDNTAGKWLKNDNASIQLVNNSNGHEYYDMDRVDDTTWSVNVSGNACNITFNRLDANKSIQWNSWSAGGRDSNNVYYVDGAEYGHWGKIDDMNSCFHTGDIVYLDLSEFTEWKKDNALMYINFSNASKEANNDINIVNADKTSLNPKMLENTSNENVYKFVIDEDSEGATELRFWRGNTKYLWNYSIVLTHDDFINNKNCIKITNWDNSGYLTTYISSGNKGSLFSDKNEIVVGQDSGIVYFYIDELENIDEEIILYEDGKSVETFYDDGDYTKHGDDIKGDGIYSIKYTVLDSNEYNSHTYYAKAGNEIITNEINIQFIQPFTYGELNNMSRVNNMVSKILKENIIPEPGVEQLSDIIQNSNDEVYNEIYADRIKELERTLSALLTENFILEYKLDIANGVYNCKYSNGIPFVIGIYNFIKSDTSNYNIISTGEDDKYEGYNTLILNAFEDSQYRTEFYEKIVDKWESEGMNIDYDDFVLVDDLKTKLSNKDLIVLSGHGMLRNSQSVFCLQDEISDETNNSKYTSDIRAERIIPVIYGDGTQSYVITSDFFEHYYGDDGLDGSFVYSESCEFMGNNENGFDFEFANAFLDCSAETVIGFYNSVMADYSRELMVAYIENLFAGNTALESINNAKEKYGSSDYQYRKPSFWQYLFDRHAFEKMGNIAYPVLVGNEKAIVNKEIKNGDFEQFIWKRIKPLFWEVEGDVRVLTKIGEIEPNGKKMAFISTGIGSKTGIGLTGTQGSTMSQVVRNTDKTKLQFNYDVLSEEPMEFINSRYDDKFEVQILDSENNVMYREIIESVNSSKWYAISDIDFDGGDSTMYHTKWKTKIIDISEFQNQTIKIKFLVYDVGDSRYDTAAVIDDVKWE